MKRQQLSYGHSDIFSKISFSLSPTFEGTTSKILTRLYFDLTFWRSSLAQIRKPLIANPLEHSKAALIPNGDNEGQETLRWEVVNQ